MADYPYNTAAWQALRRRKLADRVLCEVCMKRGRLVPATTVDHIKSVDSGGPAFPELDGLMSMCDSCHSVKTNAVDHPRGGRGVAFKGADVNGLPVDEQHPFYARKERSE